MHIEADGRDETGQLLGALSRMNRDLGSIVGQVRESADAIAGRLGRDRQRQPRPEPAHRGAGQQPGADGCLDGAVDGHRQEQCRDGTPRRRTGQRRRRGRLGGGPGGADDGRHLGQRAQDLRHHRRDRRHRLPDQHPRAECGPWRARAGGRTGARLRGRRRRGAHAGPAQRGGGARDQGADRRQRRQGRGRHGPGSTRPAPRWAASCPRSQGAGN